MKKQILIISIVVIAITIAVFFERNINNERNKVQEEVNRLERVKKMVEFRLKLDNAMGKTDKDFGDVNRYIDSLYSYYDKISK